jgi:hypothetical protein
MLKIRSVPAMLTGLLLLAGAALLGAWRTAPAPLPAMKVVKSASCGCCGKWVDYMKKEGFTITVENKDEFTALKRANGVTAELESCHTAFVGGYVVEGHVPADLVKKLLAEHPAGVKGLSAPGMPPSSPGMDMPTKEKYTVYSFDAQGKKSVYAVRQ